MNTTMRLFEGTPYDRPPRCEHCGQLEAECACPPPAVVEIAPEKQNVRLAIENRKKGKQVTALRGLQRNGWGLVSGHSTDEAAKPQALTDWLVDYFDGLAGRTLQGRPLTFGDLWGLPEGPPSTARDSLPAAQRAIDLQVMTTAVSQHLCYALPLRDKVGQFLYCRQEWEALFPRRVMAWLDQVSAVLDDPASRAAVTAERTLLAVLEAGCSAPVGALAEVAEGYDGPELLLRGGVFSLDGTVEIRLSRTATATEETLITAAEQVGRELATDLLAEGAETVLGVHHDPQP